MTLLVPVQEDESPSLQVVASVLLYRCETRTLTRDLKWRLHSFSTRSLRKILGYRWSDFVSNERLLRETDQICYLIVREHQLHLYGHVASFPDADPFNEGAL